MAQPGEWEHWRNSYAFAQRPVATLTSAAIWERFGIARERFRQKQVLDIGPGPTGRLLALEGHFVAIEPLAAKFRKRATHHLDFYAHIYESAAEEYIPELYLSCDAVLTLNCLDHCFDVPRILANCSRYLYPGGFLFISCDVDKPNPPDQCHPLKMTHEELQAAIQQAGFIIDRVDSGRCLPGDDGIWRDNWGGGTAWHWYCHKKAIEHVKC